MINPISQIKPNFNHRVLPESKHLIILITIFSIITYLFITKCTPQMQCTKMHLTHWNTRYVHWLKIHADGKNWYIFDKFESSKKTSILCSWSIFQEQPAIMLNKTGSMFIQPQPLLAADLLPSLAHMFKFSVNRGKRKTNAIIHWFSHWGETWQTLYRWHFQTHFPDRSFVPRFKFYRRMFMSVNLVRRQLWSKLWKLGHCRPSSMTLYCVTWEQHANTYIS